MSERPGISELSAEELGTVSGGCGERRGFGLFSRGAEALHALADGARAAFEAWTDRDNDCDTGGWHDDDERRETKGEDWNDEKGDWKEGDDKGDWKEGDDKWNGEKGDRRCDGGEDSNDEDDGEKEEGDKNKEETPDWDEPADGTWT